MARSAVLRQIVSLARSVQRHLLRRCRVTGSRLRRCGSGMDTELFSITPDRKAVKVCRRKVSAFRNDGLEGRQLDPRVTMAQQQPASLVEAQIAAASITGGSSDESGANIRTEGDENELRAVCGQPDPAAAATAAAAAASWQAVTSDCTARRAEQ